MKYGHIASLLAVAAFIIPASQALAQTDAEIVQTSTKNAPTPPAGLKIACMSGPSTLVTVPNCPVVKYQGVTTWAFSYIDNRVSLALVSYDSSGKLLRNVEKPGTRYLWNADSSIPNKTVNFFGQTNTSVSAKWVELGK